MAVSRRFVRHGKARACMASRATGASGSVYSISPFVDWFGSHQFSVRQNRLTPPGEHPSVGWLVGCLFSRDHEHSPPDPGRKSPSECGTVVSACCSGVDESGGTEPSGSLASPPRLYATPRTSVFINAWKRIRLGEQDWLDK